MTSPQISPEDIETRLNSLAEAKDLLKLAGIPDDDPIISELTTKFMQSLTPKGTSRGFIIVKDESDLISMDFYGKIFSKEDQAASALGNFIAKRWNLKTSDYRIEEVFSFGNTSAE